MPKRWRCFVSSGSLPPATVRCWPDAWQRTLAVKSKLFIWYQRGRVKVLIVAKTRRGAGACIGGISEHGQSVRLVAANAASNERAGQEYEVGDVWEIMSRPDDELVPPHMATRAIEFAVERANA